MVSITFILQDGERRTLCGQPGKTLLEVAWDNQLTVEGTCGGEMACSTCHVIIDPQWIEKLDPPGEEEDAILDLAWDAGSSSRLGCQIKLFEALDGMIVRLPTKADKL